MSFDSDPALYDYAAPPNVCPACFAAGQTPATLFLCLSGILRGDLWVPANGPAPNGIWQLTVSGPCAWTDAIPAIQISYVPSPAVTDLVVQSLPGGFMFLRFGAPTCQIWMPNDIVGPALAVFYSGFAMIIDPTVTGPLTETDLLEFMDDSPDSTLWVNPRPKSATETVYTFSRRSDSTNIKILYNQV